MVIKDNEAGEFWCPMTRIHSPSEGVTGYNIIASKGTVNRWEADLSDIGVSYCRGANCMMWRYVSYGKEPQDLGFCGLAGTPNIIS